MSPSAAAAAKPAPVDILETAAHDHATFSDARSTTGPVPGLDIGTLEQCRFMLSARLNYDKRRMSLHALPAPMEVLGVW